MKTIEKIDFTRVNNDSNGNPRYVCHFLSIPMTEEESKLGISERYALAVKKANTIGGKKYNTKSYGGGIVFQSYNIEEVKKAILNLNNN